MQIKVYSQSDNAMTVEIAGHVFSKNERTKRSLVRLFSFWGIALASVLIPVFHFILVPLFFLIAPFIARKTFKEEVTLESCEINCPECKKTVLFSKTSGQWPLHNNCPLCMNRIYFTQPT